jgi:hypothetical protein
MGFTGTARNQSMKVLNDDDDDNNYYYYKTLNMVNIRCTINC